MDAGITWFDEGNLMAILKTYLDVSVFSILALMNFIMLGFALERVWYFARLELRDIPDRFQLEICLTRHLTTIASIASNAPYVGLRGTVLGILITFHDLSQQSTLSATAVMLGLALALKATPAGLLVAIPATLIYNGLVRRADVLTANWHSQRSAP